MKNSKLNERIIMELERLITQSCGAKRKSEKFTQLHVALLKKYYNAADVSIDYHRHRIEMDVLMDDDSYNPGKLNINLPILHINLLFGNLKSFLRSCIEKDRKSIGFYAQLLKNFRQKEQVYSLV
ncbi:hypothetical protein NYZ99_01130 [Maribacter litopenaei]|uniref:Uncharacterized protein n=1 Tax=Maribacter litopenaei TaxID=2976127 RepID=A0ABY5Y8A2_9FLAO|nr:hypothetical protein [Maribacter litopenaei]UWX55253.1 hypothetical protein NYZ99_01130 [Maribacter litopenaei]